MPRPSASTQTFGYMSVLSFVAHFLKENGYNETLRAFEAEHGGLISTDLPHEETLEGIIADRLRYLHMDEPSADRFEEILDKDLQKIKQAQLKPWSAPYPKTDSELGPISDLVVDSAIFTRDNREFALLATSGKSLIVVDLQTKKEVSRVPAVIGNVVIRRVVTSGDLIILCGMNGKVSLGKLTDDLRNFRLLSETQIHPRLVTDVRVTTWNGKLYLVSLGWDFHVKVHEIDESDNHKLKLIGLPYKLSNQGSCLDTVVYNNRLYVLVCKREITLMDVLCMDQDDEKLQLYLDCRIALNDAEFSASGFTPTSVKIFKRDEDFIPLIAVGTSHEPHMRVIVLSMKHVGQRDDQKILRGEILCNFNTTSPQDKYSDAEIEWRYDGTGVWVVGDDGVLRGLDLTSGSVDVQLSGHDGRIKCASFYEDTVVTCGTDRKIVKWS